MAKSNSRTSVSQLIQAGREEAKNVQEIKSVATPPAEEKIAETKVTNEIPAPAVEEPVTQEETKTTEQEAPYQCISQREFYRSISFGRACSCDRVDPYF